MLINSNLLVKKQIAFTLLIIRCISLLPFYDSCTRAPRFGDLHLSDFSFLLPKSCTTSHFSTLNSIGHVCIHSPNLSTGLYNCRVQIYSLQCVLMPIFMSSTNLDSLHPVPLSYRVRIGVFLLMIAQCSPFVTAQIMKQLTTKWSKTLSKSRPRPIGGK